MASALTLERVRRDIDVLAHAGLDTAAFVSELDISLRRALPYVAACVASLDPATMLVTGTHKLGDLQLRDEHAYEWGLIEYGEAEPTAFRELFRLHTIGAGVYQTAGGDVSRSPRIRDFMRPRFDYSDEARVIASDADLVWGAVCLFRDDTAGPFNDPEIEFLKTLSPTVAAGLRSGLLAKLAATPPPPTQVGPVVIIVNADDQLCQLSVGADERLAQLAHDAHAAAPTTLISPLVAGARRYATGHTSTLPRCRVRLDSGQWYLLHASPLASAGNPTSDVVVTIEEARPPEIVPLVVAAFDLSPRERDVTQLVLQGVDTKDIAATLHMSTYTVQDHLKAIFEKAGVRSRRELIARIFFDQYIPRFGTDIAPSGWFGGS